MFDEPESITCYRVDDTPDTRSDAARGHFCAVCGAEVWLRPVNDGSALPLWCMTCAVEESERRRAAGDPLVFRPASELPWRDPSPRGPRETGDAGPGRPPGVPEASLCVYVVFNPTTTDFPGEYVVRRQWAFSRGGKPAAVAEAKPFARGPTLEAVRRTIPPGLTRWPHQPDEDPVIEESWF